MEAEVHLSFCSVRNSSKYITLNSYSPDKKQFKKYLTVYRINTAELVLLPPEIIEVNFKFYPLLREGSEKHIRMAKSWIVPAFLKLCPPNLEGKKYQILIIRWDIP
ncbi:hypothetical protein ASD98_12060 [Flavobacterium sp. Root186]|nr:hypothetical protein ASD98_12060 [Flavobacterium sp. Root186]